MQIFVTLKQIEQMKSAISKDDTRPHLTGLWVDTETGHVYASNGHRLSRRVLQKSDNQPQSLFEHVIPTEEPTVTATLSLGKDGLLKLLKKRFHKDDKLEIAFRDYGIEITVREDNVSAKYDCEHTTSLHSWASFGIKCQYLMEALRGFGDYPYCTLEFHGQLDPIILRVNDNVEVIMPLRC